jgi:hypothetical protein
MYFLRLCSLSCEVGIYHLESFDTIKKNMYASLFFTNDEIKTIFIILGICCLIDYKLQPMYCTI